MVNANDVSLLECFLKCHITQGGGVLQKRHNASDEEREIKNRLKKRHMVCEHPLNFCCNKNLDLKSSLAMAK